MVFGVHCMYFSAFMGGVWVLGHFSAPKKALYRAYWVLCMAAWNCSIFSGLLAVGCTLAGLYFDVDDGKFELGMGSCH
jgi:hypothetical protein